MIIQSILEAYFSLNSGKYKKINHETCSVTSIMFRSNSAKGIKSLRRIRWSASTETQDCIYQKTTAVIAPTHSQVYLTWETAGHILFVQSICSSGVKTQKDLYVQSTVKSPERFCKFGIRCASGSNFLRMLSSAEIENKA